MSSVDQGTYDRPCLNQAWGDLWFLAGPTRSSDSIRNIAIDEIPFLVGRRAGADLKLEFATVSGMHAELWIDDNQLLIRDLQSTNGTFVNGRRVKKETRLCESDLVHFAEAPFRVRYQSGRELTTGTISENICDQALALVQFDRLMSERLVRPHFQPIIRFDNAEIVGYELLGRGTVFGLETAKSLFIAARQLSMEVELSRMLRYEGLLVGRELAGRPTLFLNTHPKELAEPDALIESLIEIRQLAGQTQLVLEIHEAAVTYPKSLRRLQAALRELQIRLAYDDFGSGQTRLAELVAIQPDYVKFDISLIHGLEIADAQRVRMLKSLVMMLRDLNICALAEGVETVQEAGMCQLVGFDLAQGFYYGVPRPA